MVCTNKGFIYCRCLYSCWLKWNYHDFVATGVYIVHSGAGGFHVIYIISSVNFFDINGAASGIIVAILIIGYKITTSVINV